MVPSGGSGSSGGVQIGGDIGGTLAVPVVTGIQGKAVAATAPTNAQVLIWNTSLSEYVPGPVVAAPAVAVEFYPAAVSDGGTAFAAAWTRYDNNEPQTGSINPAASAQGYMAYQAVSCAASVRRVDSLRAGLLDWHRHLDRLLQRSNHGQCDVGGAGGLHSGWHGADLKLLANLLHAGCHNDRSEWDGLWPGDDGDGFQPDCAGSGKLSIQSNDANQGDLPRLPCGIGHGRWQCELSGSNAADGKEPIMTSSPFNFSAILKQNSPVFQKLRVVLCAVLLAPFFRF